MTQGEAADCPFTREMLEQAGYCYQVDLWPLADRVGIADIWDALRDVAHSAMRAWAKLDATAGVDRTYSVWAGTLEGMNRGNVPTHLGIVCVVEHEVPAMAPDTHDGELNPFDEQFPEMPEFVRVETGAPVHDGARPWYLVKGQHVIRVDADSEEYRALVDDVLADSWKGQTMLKAAAARTIYSDPEGPQAVRSAKAYLRRFLRDRSVFHTSDLPGETTGEPAPEWLQEYFDSGGVVFHTTDWRDGHETILFALTDLPNLLLNAPLHWGLGVDLDADRLAHYVVLEDLPEGDLALEFIYNLDAVSHLEQLASVATQDAVRMYVYEEGDDGAAVLSASRSMQTPEDEANCFSLIVARIIDLVADSAELLPASAIEDTPASAEAGEPGDVEQAMASLDSREVRAQAVIALARNGDPRHIGAVITAVNNMTWAEVDEVWWHLPDFGPAILDGLTELARSNKPSAAACGMRALGRMPDERSLQVLANLARIRGSKAEPFEALADMGEFALPALHELSHDSHCDVRQLAAYALGKVGAPSTRDRLVEMAEDDRSGKVKETAVQALRWLDGDKECDTDLRDFYRNVEGLEGGQSAGHATGRALTSEGTRHE